MGICCCLNPFPSLEPSDWIDLIGIVVNFFLAVWIVITIQNKLTNKRVLKDHFISEIKEIRNEYRNCLSNLYSDQTHPKRVIPWFKLMNIKVDDLMSLISKKYKVKTNYLYPYQNELRELITENEDFISQFNSDKAILFTDISKNKFIKFQQNHNQLFNNLITEINDAE